jgi:glycosyltransferase involved in cell wall biosynthesis
MMSDPPRPIRVLRLIARLNVGGPARHVVWLSEALQAHGFDTMLVTGTVPAGEEDMSAFATAHGVTPVVLSTMSRELSPRDLTTIWQLWRLMVRFRPDIVDTHTAKAGAVGRIAGILYRVLSRPSQRCRFVHTYHGHVFHSYYGRWKTRFFLTIERTLARLNTDRIIVLGEQQLREIRDTFRVGRRDQFVVLPLGIDLEALDSEPGSGDVLRAQLNIKASEKVVGIVGRLTAIKNHDLFLRVAARLGNAARFVIYGDGGDREVLEKRAGNNVIFAGTRPAAAIYDSLDIAALTSRNEGTPLALIEAMACGRPVISTAVGGVVDLLGAVEERVTDNGATFEIRERGITAASDDDAGFAAGLSRLRDEALRNALGEHAKTYVRKAHSKERLVADMIRLYRGLAAADHA